jgi:hypothetical protein
MFSHAISRAWAADTAQPVMASNAIIVFRLALCIVAIPLWDANKTKRLGFQLAALERRRRHATTRRAGRIGNVGLAATYPRGPPTPAPADPRKGEPARLGASHDRADNKDNRPAHEKPGKQAGRSQVLITVMQYPGIIRALIILSVHLVTLEPALPRQKRGARHPPRLIERRIESDA